MDAAAGETNISTPLRLLYPLISLFVIFGFVVPSLRSDRFRKACRSYAKTFAILSPYLWPSNSVRLQLCLLGAILCLLASRALSSFIPIQTGRVVDLLSDPGSQFPWKDIGIFILLRFLISSAGVALIETYLWSLVESDSRNRLSVAIYNHLMSLSSDFHDKKTSSKIMLTADRSNNLVRLAYAVLFQLSPVIIDMFVAIKVFGDAFDHHLAFVMAAVTTTYVWTSIRSKTKGSDVQRQYFNSVTEEYKVLMDVSLNWSTVFYFNRIEYERDRYASAVRSTTGYSRKYNLGNTLMKASQQLIMLTGLVTTCLLAAYQIHSKGRKLGDFVMVLVYWSQLTAPLQRASSSIMYITHLLGDAELLVELFSEKPTVRDREGAKDFEFKRGDIEFQGVRFSYEGKREVVSDISCQIEGGKTVAIVGETGCGKSTLLKLIFRLYDVSGGSVKVDGQDVRDVKLESLRRNIAVVPQDLGVFNRSILDNLRYANLDASVDDCQQSCQAAVLHKKISSFTDGYDTVVGEGGSRLSGGELQRLAIARAILKDSKIVLLDEATSNIDSDTESRIQDFLREWSPGRTVIVVAHRLSTVVDADLILAIKDGQIVESGRHRDLVDEKGYYYQLWARQTRAFGLDSQSSAPQTPQTE